MKSVTVSLPDDVYRRARIRAAERDISLSALVRELLMTLDQAESDLRHGQDRVGRDRTNRRAVR